MKIVNGKEWTEIDCQILTELYPNESNKLIAVLLHRTDISIRKKAQRLKLKKSEERIRKSRSENAKCGRKGIV